MRDLVPDGEIIAVKEGSIIVRVRSSKRAYTIVKRLDGLDVLRALFDVKSVSVSEIGASGFTTRFETQEPVDTVARVIREWRPDLIEDEVTGADLERSLGNWLSQSDLLDNARIGREVKVSGTLRALMVDLLVRFYDDQHQRDVAIEIVKLRHRRSFFNAFERVRSISIPTVLVVVATEDILRSLEEDFQKIDALEGSVRVVPVPL